ncbi:MAG: FIST C-terminal domain-containing protein [Leptospiraceae bacterium]|nr:FIST C-terminal domain-containing protein [Leptospiraceae bacterium]
MKTVNFYYESPQQLQSEMQRHGITGGSNVLVQVFAGVVDKNHTVTMLKAIRAVLPGTPVVGSTTTGEILNDSVSDNRNVISISVFSNARVRSCLAPGRESMREAGHKLARELVPDQSEPGEKVMIVFGHGGDLLEADALDLLHGITDLRPQIPIAGGRAGNARGFDENWGRSANLGQTYVFTESGLTSKGAAGASISGPGLQIHRDVNFGWKSIGRKMRIDHAERDGLFSRVYSIDNATPMALYRRYFGDAVANEMPFAGMSFPFILQIDGFEVSAMPLQVFDDESILYGAALSIGDQIQFGFGDPGLILNESIRIARTIADYPQPVEGVFVYSCATRRRQLDHVAAHELRPFQNIAPLSGFLTGGEYYHTSARNIAIDQTMTILSLSEAPLERSERKIEIPEAAERKTIDAMLAIQTLVQRMTEELELEQARSENLLLNVLPRSIANRLKAGENTIAERYNDATVLFADIVGFTELSSRQSPESVVKVLNEVFSAFDILVEKYGLEKIKTIGDAYMVAGGIPEPLPDHALRSAQLALDMLSVTGQLHDEGLDYLNIRIGLHSGPIVAGVLGSKKFAYDLWGDTVNIASRMESAGRPGQIQVSATVYERLRETFSFDDRGLIEIKGKGSMQTYFLQNEKSGPADR